MGKRKLMGDSRSNYTVQEYVFLFVLCFAGYADQERRRWPQHHTRVSGSFTIIFGHDQRYGNIQCKWQQDVANRQFCCWHNNSSYSNSESADSVFIDVDLQSTSFHTFLIHKVSTASCCGQFMYNSWKYADYELIYQLKAIGYLLCTFSLTCFGLTRPSSGAMDVKFLYIYSIWCPWCS